MNNQYNVIPVILTILLMGCGGGGGGSNKDVIIATPTPVIAPTPTVTPVPTPEVTSWLSEATNKQIEDTFAVKVNLDDLESGLSITYDTLENYKKTHDVPQRFFTADANESGDYRCDTYPDSIVAETDDVIVILPTSDSLLGQREISKDARLREINKIVLLAHAAQQELLASFGLDNDFFNIDHLDDAKFLDQYYVSFLEDLARFYLPMMKNTNQDKFIDESSKHLSDKVMKEAANISSAIDSTNRTGRFLTFNQSSWDQLPAEIKGIFNDLEDDNYLFLHTVCGVSNFVALKTSECNGGGYVANLIPMLAYIGEANTNLLINYFINNDTIVDGKGRAVKTKYIDKPYKITTLKQYICALENIENTYGTSSETNISFADSLLGQNGDEAMNVFSTIKHELTHSLLKRVAPNQQLPLYLSEGIAIHQENKSNTVDYITEAKQEWQRENPDTLIDIDGIAENSPLHYARFKYFFDNLKSQSGAYLTNTEKLNLIFMAIKTSYSYVDFNSTVDEQDAWYAKHYRVGIFYARTMFKMDTPNDPNGTSEAAHNSRIAWNLMVEKLSDDFAPSLRSNPLSVYAFLMPNLYTHTDQNITWADWYYVSGELMRDWLESSLYMVTDH